MSRTVDSEALSRPATTSAGYDDMFLGTEVAAPSLTDAVAADAVQVDGSTVIPYTHFSLTLSASRGFAHWVAWNVDGDQMKRLSRSSQTFRLDPRVPAKHQVGNELYADNPIDRGHIARRADLTWGTDAAARQANSDSFYFTNISPQMDDFNQGARQGVWGRLEDALYEEVEVERRRICVMAGPVLHPEDRIYRGVRIPREFWKVIAFVDHGGLEARTFLLTQNLARLQTIGLEEFRTYQVRLDTITRRTGVTFDDSLHAAEDPIVMTITAPRPLETIADIVW